MEKITSSNRLPGKLSCIPLLLATILWITFIAPAFAQIQPEKTTEESKKPEDKKKEESPVRKWGLDLSGGPYQSNQKGASTGFSINLAVRYLINPNLANDLAIGYTQYRIEILSPERNYTTLTVWQVPITDSVVFFFHPDSNIMPYLIMGTGLWVTTISGREIAGLDKNRISWGGQIGGGIKIATAAFSLNFRIIYLMPDFGDPEDGAIQYGFAVGTGF